MIKQKHENSKKLNNQGSASSRLNNKQVISQIEINGIKY